MEVITEEVPADLGTEQFFASLLDRTPAAFHVRARELMTGKDPTLEEGVEPVGYP